MQRPCKPLRVKSPRNHSQRNTGAIPLIQWFCSGHIVALYYIDVFFLPTSFSGGGLVEPCLREINFDFPQLFSGPFSCTDYGQPKKLHGLWSTQKAARTMVNPKRGCRFLIPVGWFWAVKILCFLPGGISTWKWVVPKMGATMVKTQLTMLISISGLTNHLTSTML